VERPKLAFAGKIDDSRLYDHNLKRRSARGNWGGGEAWGTGIQRDPTSGNPYNGASSERLLSQKRESSFSQNFSPRKHLVVYRLLSF